MKLIYLLLTITFLNNYTDAYPQRITYSAKNVPLKTIFSAIQKQTGFGFFYDQKLLAQAESVSLDVKNAPLSDVLAAIFESQSLDYTVENKTILVSKKKSPTIQKIKQKQKAVTKQSVQKSVNIDPSPVKKAEEENIAETKNSETAEIKPDTLANSISKDPAKPAKAQVATGDSTLPKSETGNSAKDAQLQSGPITSEAAKTASKGIFKHLFPPIQMNKISFGFKGGMNSSRINATEINGSKSGYIGTELYAGFFADTRMTEKLNMGTELIFSFTDSYHFIEVPLHFKFNIREKWNLMAGPKLEYIADYMDDFDYFKRVGISAEIGSQYQLNPVFFAEARYAYGFTPQINSPGFGFYDGKRNTFRLGLGINFNRQEEVGKVSKDLGPMRLRAGLSTGIALTSGYDIVVGGDLRIQKNLGSANVGMLSVGYNHYSLKSGFIETNLAYFPIKAGMKFFLDNDFYVAPEAGVAIGTKSEVYTVPFLYAAGIGKKIGNGFDVSLRYEKLTGRIVDYLDEIRRPAQIALRVEYGFNLNSDKAGTAGFNASKYEPAATGKRKKAVFFELQGNGGRFSGNFDMRLKPDRNDGWGFRAGAGVGASLITFPIALNYIAGKRRHGFETGIGITPVYNSQENGSNILGDPYGSEKFHAAGFLSTGYRFQSYKGFMFRANMSVGYSSSYFFFGWPGLSFGYSFK